MFTITLVIMGPILIILSLLQGIQWWTSEESGIKPTTLPQICCSTTLLSVLNVELHSFVEKLFSSKIQKDTKKLDRDPDPE